MILYIFDSNKANRKHKAQNITTKREGKELLQYFDDVMIYE